MDLWFGDRFPMMPYGIIPQLNPKIKPENIA